MFGKVRTCVLNMPMNEGSGDPHDSSGYDNNGTNNGADWVSGRRGYALDFNGTTDYVNCGNGTSLDITNEITISAWVKPTPPHLSGYGGIYNNISGRLNSRLLVKDDGSTLAQVFIAGTTQNVAGTDVVNNQWNHIVYRYDGSNEAIFTNGVKGANYPKGGDINTGLNDQVIGWGHSMHANYHFNGSISDVRIYNRALSDAKILANFNAESTITRDCVLNMPMNEGQGHPHDSSGYGNNGTNNGADWVSGTYGWAMEFNGTSDYVDCGNDASLDITDEITISAWIYTDSLLVGYIIAKNNLAVNDAQYSLYYDAKDIFGFLDSGAVGGTTGDAVSLGSWHNIVMRYDKTDVRYYVDGVLASTPFAKNGSITPTNFSVNIGRRKPNNILFNGSIDQVRVYNRALSAAEILDYFNGVKARYGL